MATQTQIQIPDETCYSEIKRAVIDELNLSTFYYKHDKKEHMSFKGNDLLKCLKKILLERARKGITMPESIKRYTVDSSDFYIGLNNAELNKQHPFEKAANFLATEWYSKGIIKDTIGGKIFSTSHKYHFVDKEGLQFVDDRLEIEAHKCCNYNLENWPIVRITIVGYQRSDEKFQSVYLDGLSDILKNYRPKERCIILYDLTEYKIFPKKQMDAQLAWQTEYDAIVKQRSHGISVIVTTTVVRGFLNMLVMVQPFPVETKFFKNEEKAVSWMIKQYKEKAKRLKRDKEKKMADINELKGLARI